MKKLISVSTKKGDKGQSRIINGNQFSKNDIVFEALGTLDELNSHLGLVVVKIRENPSKDVLSKVDYLLELQNTLFYLGAQLAGSKKEKLSDLQLETLEKESDVLQLTMADNWITKFVLPGGTEIGATLDIARTVCRRLERNIVSLSQKQEISPIVLKYLNRLSDYLFILRCYMNDKLGVEEHLFESK